MIADSAMKNLILVALGGALGSASRYIVSMLAIRLCGDGFGWGTLAVNLAGCLAIGILTGLADLALLEAPWRIFLVTGVLGGLTTFSTFSNETVRHLASGQYAAGFLNMAFNVLAGLALSFAGLKLARAFAQMLAT